MATTRAVPQSSCLHPSCHAHQAHPVSRLAARLTTPPAAAVTLRRPWYRKITKNVVIGFLTVIVIGLASSLNNDDHQIADLKTKASHSTAQLSQTAQTSPVDRLQYAITYCDQVVAKEDSLRCVKDLLAIQN